MTVTVHLKSSGKATFVVGKLLTHSGTSSVPECVCSFFGINKLLMLPSCEDPVMDITLWEFLIQNVTPTKSLCNACQYICHIFLHPVILSAFPSLLYILCNYTRR